MLSQIHVRWMVIYRVDNAIHRINLHPAHKAIGFPNNAYPLGSDLSVGLSFPKFEQPGLMYKLTNAGDFFSFSSFFFYANKYKKQTLFKVRYYT